MPPASQRPHGLSRHGRALSWLTAARTRSHKRDPSNKFSNGVCFYMGEFRIIWWGNRIIISWNTPNHASYLSLARIFRAVVFNNSPSLNRVTENSWGVAQSQILSLFFTSPVAEEVANTFRLCSGTLLSWYRGLKTPLQLSREARDNFGVFWAFNRDLKGN